MSLERARALRKNMPHAERLLWKYLSKNQLGVRFRRQVPIGPYIVDFISFYPPIVIECDGEQHAFNQNYDKARDQFLESLQFKVLRFWNEEIFRCPGRIVESVMEAIKKAESKPINSPPPPSLRTAPPPKRGGCQS